MRRADERAAEARRQAEAVWRESRKREAERLSEKEKERQASAMKTARLRELRLAKEAADKALAAANPAGKPQRKRRTPAKV